jgi:hypothetical protein
MPRVYRHWLYEAYLALAAANGPYGLNLSEADARNKIKDFYPNFAHFVNDIIDAGGDLTKIPEHTLTQSAEIINQEAMNQAGVDMNARLRSGAGRVRNGSGQFAKALEGGQEGEEDDTQSGGQREEQSMNDRLRQRRSKLPSDVSGQGINDAIRRASHGH